MYQNPWNEREINQNEVEKKNQREEVEEEEEEEEGEERVAFDGMKD